MIKNVIEFFAKQKVSTKYEITEIMNHKNGVLKPKQNVLNSSSTTAKRVSSAKNLHVLKNIYVSRTGSN